jgi:hypothetical protein
VWLERRVPDASLYQFMHLVCAGPATIVMFSHSDSRDSVGVLFRRCGAGSAGLHRAKRNRGLPPIRLMSRRAEARGQTALPTRRQRTRHRAHLRCESQPGAAARPLAGSAAGRQPAGEESSRNVADQLPIFA